MPPKFLKVESKRFPCQAKKKKHFTINSTDLSKFLSNNPARRSRSGTPQINKKFQVSNLSKAEQLKSLNGQAFISGYMTNPVPQGERLRTPLQTKTPGQSEPSLGRSAQLTPFLFGKTLSLQETMDKAKKPKLSNLIQNIGESRHNPRNH